MTSRPSSAEPTGVNPLAALGNTLPPTAPTTGVHYATNHEKGDGMGSYVNARRELLDVLKNLHSTG